jgi:hypothetical protein
MTGKGWFPCNESYHRRSRERHTQGRSLKGQNKTHTHTHTKKRTRLVLMSGHVSLKGGNDVDNKQKTQKLKRTKLFVLSPSLFKDERETFVVWSRAGRLNLARVPPEIHISIRMFSICYHILGDTAAAGWGRLRQSARRIRFVAVNVIHHWSPLSGLSLLLLLRPCVILSKNYCYGLLAAASSTSTYASTVRL